MTRYTSRASELLGRLRAEISKGRRLMGTTAINSLATEMNLRAPERKK